MKIFAAAAAVAICVAICAASPATAASNAEIARQWGLLGTWAPDCTMPPSNTNYYATFVVEGMDLVHRREWGGYAGDTNKVLRANLLGEVIELEVRFANLDPPQTRVWGSVKEGNRIHTKYNLEVNGPFSIRDFVILAGGAPSPWLTKCR
jgi:hypothetical protein